MKKIVLFLILSFGIGTATVFAINNGPTPKDPSNEYKQYKCKQAAQGDAKKIAQCKKKFPT